MVVSSHNWCPISLEPGTFHLHKVGKSAQNRTMTTPIFQEMWSFYTNNQAEPAKEKEKDRNETLERSA